MSLQRLLITDFCGEEMVQMKKVLTAILIVLLIVAGVLGGTYVYISNSKSPTAVAARTLAKLKTVESASVKMNVDTGVKAEVGILQYFGIKDPETTITMDYDIDMFKDPALLHTYVSIKAFDIEAIKNIETIFIEEDGGLAEYYHWNDNWYRYFAKEEDQNTEDETGIGESAADGVNDGYAAEDDIESEEASEYENYYSEDAEEVLPDDNSSENSTYASASAEDLIAGNSPEENEDAPVLAGNNADIGTTRAGKTLSYAIDSMKNAALIKGGQFSAYLKSLSANGKSQDAKGEADTEAEFDTVDTVDFTTILSGIVDGSLDVEMRKEKETVNGRECFVYDFNLTGDMLEKIIRFSNGNKSLFPKLNKDERVTGQLYIDAKESLPTKMVLTSDEILSEQMAFEAIGTSFSVTKIDIDVDVVGYNTAEEVSVPTEYVDVNSLSDLDAMQWLNLALDFAGLRDA